MIRIDATGTAIVSKVVFIIGLIFSLTPLASSPVALALGLIFGFLFKHPYPNQSKRLSRKLLYACVAGLGFGMNISEVLRAGSASFLYTALGISVTMALGVILGRLLKVGQTDAFLIAIGTAICGGSAIAAVGPVINANDEEMSISLSTIFILNSVALLAFPLIGIALGMTQMQFGLWSALAIHDTSSVVGASAKYGVAALQVATVVKLARALWIVPVAFSIAALRRNGTNIHWPWFILFFVLAAIIATYLPAGASLYKSLEAMARTGLTVTLYLIGSNISRATLKTAGIRPLVQGTVLWLVVSAVSLMLIHLNIITL